MVLPPADQSLPLPEAVCQMAAFDELCRLNPRLRELILQIPLNTEDQLHILRLNAAAEFFFNDNAMEKQIRALEYALRQHLKREPPLTRRPRRGKL